LEPPWLRACDWLTDWLYNRVKLNWVKQKPSSTTCSVGGGAPADESIVAGVLLLEDIVGAQIGATEMHPAAQRHDVRVDVDADAVNVQFALVQTLADCSRSGDLARTDGRVTGIPFPLRLTARLYTTRHTPLPAVHEREREREREREKFI